MERIQSSFVLLLWIIYIGLFLILLQNMFVNMVFNVA